MPVKAKQLIKIGAATLSDALGKTGAMHHEMRPRSAQAKMAGPAFTVRVHPADILMVTPALAACPPGQVLVIDGGGERNTALWGEITTEAAHRKGLAGVVINGALRDSHAIARSPLPVFALAIVPNAGGAEYPGELGVTVACAGAVVQPGDWVVGDEDGVVVIPAGQLDAAIARALEIVAAEKRIIREMRRGRELADILHISEKLERKRAAGVIPQLAHE